MANSVPNYPRNILNGDTCAYHTVHKPRMGQREISPSDCVRPFSEIDKLLAWFYNPKTKR